MIAANNVPLERQNACWPSVLFLALSPIFYTNPSADKACLHSHGLSKGNGTMGRTRNGLSRFARVRSVGGTLSPGPNHSLVTSRFKLPPSFWQQVCINCNSMLSWLPPNKGHNQLWLCAAFRVFSFFYVFASLMLISPLPLAGILLPGYHNHGDGLHQARS
jgi:hypothetical protein